MSDKLDFLAFGAHPDDVELGCGATIAKLISKGKKVGIIDLTRGELGTRGSAEIRTKETKEASKILGISSRENMNFKDGFFLNDEKHQLKIIQVIRKYQPEFIFCNAPDDRHSDHPKGSQLVIEASFLSGLSKINTKDISGNSQKKWRPKKPEYTSGTLWKYSQSVGPAFKGAVTHPGASKEKKCYADI